MTSAIAQDWGVRKTPGQWLVGGIQQMLAASSSRRAKSRFSPLRRLCANREIVNVIQGLRLEIRRGQTAQNSANDGAAQVVIGLESDSHRCDLPASDVIYRRVPSSRAVRLGGSGSADFRDSSHFSARALRSSSTLP
jgi:hypothetical protein